MQEADIDRTLHQEAVRIGRAAVIEVQEALYAVVNEERGITNWAVSRGCESLYDDVESTVAHRDARLGLDKGMEPELLKGFLELWEWVGRENHHRVLVAVGLEPLRVKMVPMQMADVEVIGGTQGGMVELVVSRIWEPSCVIRRSEPWITQDGAMRGVDLDSGLGNELNPHGGRIATICAQRPT